MLLDVFFFFCVKQKTAYEVRISDWSSDVCSSDLAPPATLADIKTASQAIVDSGAANQGYAMEQRAWYVEQLFATSGEQIVNENNGRDARATEALLDSEAGEAGFPWPSEMLDDGLAHQVGPHDRRQAALPASDAGHA